MGRIADIFHVQGELDKALTIRLCDQIPVFDTLKDYLYKSITMSKIADTYMQQERVDEALNIYINDVLPIYEEQGNRRQIAVIKGKIANTFHSQGLLEKASDIYKNEVLPIFKELGDVREVLIARTNLSIILYEYKPENYLNEVQKHLCLSLKDARNLRIREAESIENLLEKMGLSCLGT